jgi:putative transposase
VGLNPVRAGLTKRAIEPPWSSVRSHLEGRPDPLLTPGPLAERLGGALDRFFDLDVAEAARRALRRASTTGRPLGATARVKALEKSTGRDVTPAQVGRPPQHRQAQGPELEMPP